MIRAATIIAAITASLLAPCEAAGQSRRKADHQWHEQHAGSANDRTPFYVRNRERFSRERHHEIEREVRRVRRAQEYRDRDLDYETDVDLDSED